MSSNYCTGIVENEKICECLCGVLLYLLSVVTSDEPFCSGYRRGRNKAANASALGLGSLVNQLSLIFCEVNESFPAKTWLTSPSGCGNVPLGHQWNGNTT